MTTTTSFDDTRNKQQQLSLDGSPYSKILSTDLPEGHCVCMQKIDNEPLISIKDAKNDWLRSLLHPEELGFGSTLSEIGLESFCLGRVAMKYALYPKDAIILKDDHGRPTLPEGHVGSISHKGNIGVALVANCDSTTKGVGIDIEKTSWKRQRVTKRILTPREIEALGNVEGVTADEEVLLRFSLKESLYKAMHPLICQFVGFQEAEVTPHSNGTASMECFIKSGVHEQFDSVTAHWQRIKFDEQDYFLTSASVALKHSDDSEPCTFD